MRRRRNLLHLCVAGKGKYLPRQNSESNRFEMTFRLNLAQKGVEGAFRKTRCHPPRGQCVVFPVDDFHSTFGGRGVKCGFAVCQLDANCYCPLISLDIALPPSSFWKCACPIQRRAAVSMYVCIRVVSFLLVQQLDQDFLEINSSINEASIFFFYSFEVLSSFSVPINSNFSVSFSYTRSVYTLRNCCFNCLHSYLYLRRFTNQLLFISDQDGNVFK